ncbi:SRPBCC family protein [Actinoplanes hulinensis]|uniref:SRPBCC family protein n=1 Tax=Actinoplanes hulinensis TaxID=1144547 RepID=A0ABS7B227_9ACTN|nr:SRPBCC family protein [Actinoplanes hulinensis]MBW6434977.1 SRPBCC family protein [Actinoplanes hulinensis]
MRFDVETQASPEQVWRAFTDFTDRRPRIWKSTLDPKTYKVREQGDTWAVARESTPGSPFWVVARYDWSEPTVIRWTVVESSYGGDGDGFVRIAPAGAGGSRVHAEWTSTHARSQRLMLFLLHRGPLHRMISRMWTTTLDRYAREGR